MCLNDFGFLKLGMLWVYLYCLVVGSHECNEEKLIRYWGVLIVWCCLLAGLKRDVCLRGLSIWKIGRSCRHKELTKSITNEAVYQVYARVTRVWALLMFEEHNATCLI